MLPVACGKVDRRLGEASESRADLTDHTTKSLVVLNSPGGLQRQATVSMILLRMGKRHTRS